MIEQMTSRERGSKSEVRSLQSLFRLSLSVGEESQEGGWGDSDPGTGT